MTMLCQYASNCPRRVRDGDRPDGCSSKDQSCCSPDMDVALPVQVQPRQLTMYERIAERYLFSGMFDGSQERA